MSALLYRKESVEQSEVVFFNLLEFFGFFKVAGAIKDGLHLSHLLSGIRQEVALHLADCLQLLQVSFVLVVLANRLVDVFFLKLTAAH